MLRKKNDYSCFHMYNLQIFSRISNKINNNKKKHGICLIYYLFMHLLTEVCHATEGPCMYTYFIFMIQGVPKKSIASSLQQIFIIDGYWLTTYHDGQVLANWGGGIILRNRRKNMQFF